MWNLSSKKIPLTTVPEEQCVDHFQKIWEDPTPILVYGKDWKSTQCHAIEEKISAISAVDFPLYRDSFLVTTGGTSGQLKIAVLKKSALAASVQAMQSHFELSKINSLCLLPLYHVSGLLQLIRSFLSGGDFVSANYQDFKNDQFPSLSDFCLSLVPTQWNFLKQSSTALRFLQKQQYIFLGGAPCSLRELSEANEHQIPLRPVYGMTETCAMIASAKIENPHSNKIVYSPFDQVLLTKSDRDTLTISTPQLFSGYIPNTPRELLSFQTEDLVQFQEEGFSILGRNDQIIISGGKKIVPQEVSEVLQNLFSLSDLYITSREDPHWGQKMICYYVAEKKYSTAELKSKSASILASHQIPKEWIALSKIPRNAAGKIQAAALPKT